MSKSKQLKIISNRVFQCPGQCWRVHLESDGRDWRAGGGRQLHTQPGQRLQPSQVPLSQKHRSFISRFFFLKTRKENYLISPCVRHVAVGWGVVEDTLKAEVERRKENVGKRVTKVNPRTKAAIVIRSSH